MPDHSLPRSLQSKHKGTDIVQQRNPFLCVVYIYRLSKGMDLLKELGDLLRDIRRDWHSELVVILGVGALGLSASVRMSVRHFG